MSWGRRVAGFDPSYQARNTGFAVVESGAPRPTLIAYGIIKQEGKTEAERFASLQLQVESLCAVHKVVKAAVEKPPPFSYSRSQKEDGKPLNIDSFMKNATAAAVIIASLGRSGIRVVEAHAHLWKSHRNVNLCKEDMKRLALATFPELRDKQLSEHEAEAVCLAVLNI